MNVERCASVPQVCLSPASGSAGVKGRSVNGRRTPEQSGSYLGMLTKICIQKGSLLFIKHLLNTSPKGPGCHRDLSSGLTYARMAHIKISAY